MFLQHSDGQPWSHKRHYHEGGSHTDTRTWNHGGKIRKSLYLINCLLSCVFNLLSYKAIVIAMDSILSF